ncbi:cupin domain-containing protein [Clostridiaceae bacterium M8S5]|nr:cupin domain-containing protein [Clostridiaceae bacterium M8S5]
MEEKFIKNIDFSEVLELKNLIDYVDGGVESRTLVQREDFSMTLFAFDEGEGVSEYSMPGDTMIYVFEGKAQITINEESKNILCEGKSIVIPPDVLHSIDVLEKSKIMIVIVKPQS